MKLKKVLFISMLCAICAFSCDDDDDNGGGTPSPNDSLPENLPNVEDATFSNSTNITNPYYGPPADMVYIYEGGEIGEDPEEEIRIERRADTREVMGVTTIIQNDQVFLDSVLIEDTDDWLAQDDDGNLWYFGEEVKNYDDEGNFEDDEGSWEAGVEGALPGYWLPANPTVGQNYYQEYWEGEAEDQAEVISVDTMVTTELATYNNCLVTKDINPFDEGEYELKFYAPNIGLVKEEKYDDSDVLIKMVELVEIAEVDTTSTMLPEDLPDITEATFTNPTDITNTYYGPPVGSVYIYEGGEIGEDAEESIRLERSSETREVMGITTIIQNDQVFVDSILVENTDDWLAQDDDGNVWYFGEAVENFDEEGNFLDSAGAWEAGVDGALPGYWLPANPEVGQTYYQEYYEGEAEDQAEVVSLDTTITIGLGTYENCLVTKDINPFEEDVYELKFYAPNVGLIKEEKYEGDDELVEVVELVEIE
ncbi:hypothetical protein V6R21_09670 [Limibacter armeniacum]|uniref:hypothetical protein n=1 Tax=Limibacter armeniacum TaxID=466084 RepID=UPI002FE6B8EC